MTYEYNVYDVHTMYKHKNEKKCFEIPHLAEEENAQFFPKKNPGNGFCNVFIKFPCLCNDLTLAF